MKTYILKFILFVLVSLNFSEMTAQITVTNITELKNAIVNASPGSTIILANGVWSNTTIDINKNGTITNPITIKAQNVGQVYFEGNSRISLGGNYIIIEGFVFQNPSNLISSGGRIEPVIEFRDSKNNECFNCTITNIKIDGFNGTSAQEEDVFKWIIIYGQYNEISHSSFIGKHGVGSIINDNRNDSNPDYTKIHHNYFAKRTPVGELNNLNDQDAIRIGNSSTSLSDSFTEVYNNFFYDWAGEVEIISNKSGKNKFYNNTFRNYYGTLTLRHGNNSEVFNNFFFANNNKFSGGIRVIGEGHKIYNNYIEGVNSTKPNGSKTKTAGGINVSNGKPNSELNEYYQVKNVTITNNTLVNCDYGIRIGTNVKSELTLSPENITVANNIMFNSSINAFDELTTPIGDSKYEGNINQNGNWDLTNGVNNNKTVTSDLLTSGTYFYKLIATSPAIDAAIGTYNFLTTDILGSTRTTPFDVGAEEYGGNGTNIPYKIEDVGNKIGFLSSPSPYIVLSTNTLNLNNSSANIDFDIKSNVDWTISDTADWLSVNSTNGSKGEKVTLTITENNTGTTRSGIVTISENGGSLSATLTIHQSNEDFNPNNADILTGITVTGVGTQDPNIPENTLDENYSTRWSGNSTDGSSYLTYDLQCAKTVTNIKIYFHKGNSRTSSFKIATSNDGVNFTDVTTILTSSGTMLDFENFPLASNPLIRYIRIYGYGNSESAWNSYEEVKIFGNNSCSTLSVDNYSLKGISLYPVPTTGDYIYLKSSLQKIGTIEIFDIKGSSLIKRNFNNTNAQIKISALSKGVYILKIQGAYKRFIIQ